MIKQSKQGFTVIELLTVISIVTVLMAVLVPVLRQTCQYGRRVLGIHRQREIVNAVTLFACENDDEFPPSVALCRISGSRYRWQDPRKVKTTRPLTTMQHNSVAGYLETYLDHPESLYCPSSPGHWEYWQEAWEAQDHWDHPETATVGDPVFGTYGLYWNYTGFQTDSERPFRGSASLTGGPGQSTLLVSDYFGADEWRRRRSFGCCAPFVRAQPVNAGDYYCPYWASQRQGDLETRGTLALRLYAGYSDGSVTGYNPAETEIIEAAEDALGWEPYSFSDERWPGYFFVPNRAISTLPKSFNP